MKIGVRMKIDVSKLDKTAFFQGKKGVYATLTSFIDLDNVSEFGDSGMITQDLGKERNQSGEKGAILGNSKVFWKGEGAGKGGGPYTQGNGGSQQSSSFDDSDSIPF